MTTTPRQRSTTGWPRTPASSRRSRERRTPSLRSCGGTSWRRPSSPGRTGWPGPWSTPEWAPASSPSSPWPQHRHPRTSSDYAGGGLPPAFPPGTTRPCSSLGPAAPGPRRKCPSPYVGPASPGSAWNRTATCATASSRPGTRTRSASVEDPVPLTPRTLWQLARRSRYGRLPVPIQPFDEHLRHVLGLIGHQHVVRLRDHHELGAGDSAGDDAAVLRRDERIQLPVYDQRRRGDALHAVVGIPSRRPDHLRQVTLVRGSELQPHHPVLLDALARCLGRVVVGDG